jgi:hypothetical protein
MLVRILGLAPLAFSTTAMAAETDGTAHLYAYHLLNHAAFEQGYRRHLDWHRHNADPLVWYAWYVVAGDRRGAFVDGTFGTTPERLAKRPDPQGDRADFRTNVGPYVTALGDEGWELVRTAGSFSPLEARKPRNLMHVYVIELADPAAFEAAISTHPLAQGTWYRSLQTTMPRYLLMVSTSSTKAPPPLPIHVPGRTLRGETWQYVPRLALVPTRPLRR